MHDWNAAQLQDSMMMSFPSTGRFINLEFEIHQEMLGSMMTLGFEENMLTWNLMEPNSIKLLKSASSRTFFHLAPRTLIRKSDSLNIQYVYQTLFVPYLMRCVLDVVTLYKCLIYVCYLLTIYHWV